MCLFVMIVNSFCAKYSDMSEYLLTQQTEYSKSDQQLQARANTVELYKPFLTPIACPDCEVNIG